MFQATLNNAVADATLDMLPRERKASAAAGSFVPLLIWATAVALGTVAHASRTFAFEPRQFGWMTPLLKVEWATIPTQVFESLGVHQWQAVPALQHTQPNSLTAVPSTAAWLQTTAQQTSHAVAMIVSAVSQPMVLVWLVAGVVVLHMLLWLTRKLLGLVLHGAWSLLALAWRSISSSSKDSSEQGSEQPREPDMPRDNNIRHDRRQATPAPPAPWVLAIRPQTQAEARKTRQVQRNLGIKRGAPYGQDITITQVVTQPAELTELLSKKCTRQRWSRAIREGMFEDITTHLATLPLDTLYALISSKTMPAVGALSVEFFADKPKPERKLQEFLAFSLIMLRSLAANPNDRAQFLSIMTGYVTAPMSVQGDTFKTCRERLYRNTHRDRYTELQELLGQDHLLGPVLINAVPKYVKCAAAVFVARLMVWGVVAA